MIRVLIAEDMRLLRETLVASLELEDDLEVVAVLAAGDAIVATVAAEEIDLAILDIDLPGVDGLTAAARIRRDHPHCRVLILTSLANPGHIRRAIDIGVSGFVLKDSSRRELLHAVRTVASGGSVLDPGLAFTALRGPANPLTGREADVLRCLAAGADPKQIAAQLHLSHGTVRNYLAAAATKLQARTRVDAVRIAQQAGWL
ncbi:response regulator transcription factor [Nocardia pseudobrasiliensis]|uniref:LuxR family two component transcriptional regulator n=1 Tax=Nocardia pseudobrasiliensis TaxID=45979 RepID=A0A370I2U7_9NOCA|nr:response regulator transcription factor [Nocardia pseudobrasiliensis]RDI65059.1 LuxR family two component transcriptional regulator [Nocardia pseudobrasiliensis]